MSNFPELFTNKKTEFKMGLSNYLISLIISVDTLQFS